MNLSTSLKSQSRSHDAGIKQNVIPFPLYRVVPKLEQQISITLSNNSLIKHHLLCGDKLSCEPCFTVTGAGFYLILDSENLFQLVYLEASEYDLDVRARVVKIERYTGGQQ